MYQRWPYDPGVAQEKELAGHWGLPAAEGAYLVAFALPK
jgi:hypothetical protein